VVDVVVPVHNGADALNACVARLRDHLADSLPLRWRITIVDSASTDETWKTAQELAEQLSGVTAVRVEAEGRGRAVRAAWEASDAFILAYVDVELSTDLNAFLPLVAPLLSGHSDVAVGSRFSRGAQVARTPRRGLNSRRYSRLLSLTLGTEVRDTQCSFKAVRADVARVLLPAVHANNWFFDTEFLVLAERLGLRIAELPVDWTGHPNTDASETPTQRHDLRGIWRLGKTLWLHRVNVELGESVPQRGPAGNGNAVFRFLRVALCCVALFLAGFLALQPALGAYGANGLSLTTVTLVCGFASRRYAHGRRAHLASRYRWLKAIAVYAGSLAGTTAVLKILFLSSVKPSLTVQATVATLIAALVVSLRLSFIFERAAHPDDHEKAGNLTVDGSYA
jgi:glycosyltransferase involved in cell wall biosynthesis